MYIPQLFMGFIGNCRQVEVIEIYGADYLRYSYIFTTQ